MSGIFLYLAICLGINLTLFVPAYLLKTDKLTDISYALSFVVVAIIGYERSDKSILHALFSACVVLWAVRLGGFLYIRIMKNKSDKRFDGIREHAGKFLQFWALQGLSVFIVISSGVVLWEKQHPVVTIGSAIGIGVFGFGLVFEAVADWQKYQFSLKKRNKGLWVSAGLWKLSRHPNYFGEIVVWLGLFIVAFDQLSTLQVGIAAMSPLYIATLLLFVSGMPILEKSADKKWGHDKKYQQYKKQTPLLLPRFPSH